ncbi:MAG: FAD-dependent oxidoreductase, partial [Gammaproteobacteria bacterium]|nr:FAD-dependent oxidoreductase [Gammaproteobacteria bacterium]NIU41038.1 FAD-dependent oxidoreductase [Gammaproteobacteria bacterium]
ALKEAPGSKNLILRYADAAGHPEGEKARGTRAGVREEEFDLVVLSVGMEIPETVRALGRKLGIELDDHGFCRTARFNPLQTSRPGVYAIG